MNEPKLCVDCRYFDLINCRHPNNLRTSLVSGEPEPRLSPHYLRDEERYCAPTANWFEPKQETTV